MTQPYSFGGYIKNHAENVPQLFSSTMDSTGSSGMKGIRGYASNFSTGFSS